MRRNGFDRNRGAGPRTYDANVRREDRDRWIAEILRNVDAICVGLRGDPRNAPALGCACDYAAPLYMAQNIRAVLRDLPEIVEELIELERIMDSKADAAIGRPIPPKRTPPTTGSMFGGVA